MPLNGFSVGRDVSLNINTSTGTLNLSLITSFKSRQQVVKKSIKGLDGKTRTLKFPNGWAGSFDVERQDATLDDYIAQDEANYYAGQDNPTITITETITEVDGSVSQYQYKNCTLTLSDAGDKKGDDTIKQSLEFESEQRLKLT